MQVNVASSLPCGIADLQGGPRLFAGLNCVLHYILIFIRADPCKSIIAPLLSGSLQVLVADLCRSCMLLLRKTLWILGLPYPPSVKLGPR